MILASLLDKDVENLDDYGCPKVQDHRDDKVWICSSYPFRRKALLHCAELKATMFGNCIMLHLKLKSLYYELDCHKLLIYIFQNCSMFY